MKLTVQNFKCYKEERTFEFDDSGLFLISAQSGKGKSTILVAIHFALYGSKSNLCTFGETSCRVEFIFKDLKIVRTKKPNRLVVNDIYEDKVAQEIIDEVFGKHFEVTGYISQNSTDSFIHKNSTAKLEFLESFAFDNEDLAEKKANIKILIQTTSDKWNKSLTQLEMSKAHLAKIDVPIVVEFPILTPHVKNRELGIKNERNNFTNAKNNISKVSKKIEKKQQALNDLAVLNTYLLSKDETINQICSQLENLSLELKNDFIGEEKLMWYQEQLAKIRKNSQLYHFIAQRDADELKIKSMKDTELQDLHASMEKIKTELWNDYTKEEATSVIQNNEDALKDISQIKFLKNKKQVIKDMELLTAKKTDIVGLIEEKKAQYQQLLILICPGCESNLLMKNGVLVTCEEDIKSSSSSIPTKGEEELLRDIQNLQNSLKKIDMEILQQENSVLNNEKIDKEINDILSQYEQELDEDELRSDLKVMQNYLKYQTVLEGKLRENQDKIKKESFSSSYQSFKKEFDKLNQKIDVLQKSCREEEEEEVEGQENEDELRDIISKEQTKQQHNKQVKKQLILQNEQKQELLSQVENYKSKFIEKYSSIPIKNELLMEIKTLEEELQHYKTKLIEHEANLEQITKYLQYEKIKTTYEQYQNEVIMYEQQEKVDQARFNSAKNFKQKFLETESIALMNVMETINYHASQFLEEFFDDPISVHLSCFKEDKKKNDKPQINVDVIYKDMNCDLWSLSGGEFSRVVLAFTLSLAEICRAPMLLLDETTSSLDGELTYDVYSSIKNHFRDTPVISILHQVTEGIFDKVIKL